MMFTIFDRLITYFEKNKKPQLHHKWFLINCASLVNGKGPRFRTQPSKSCKTFPQNTVHDQKY